MSWSLNPCSLSSVYKLLRHCHFSEKKKNEWTKEIWKVNGFFFQLWLFKGSTKSIKCLIQTDYYLYYLWYGFSIIFNFLFRFILFQGTSDFEAYYPNISKPYREPSTCTNWSKKPRRKKKPGEDEEELDFEDEDNVVGVERQEKTKVYISVHESSRLNQSDYNSSFCWQSGSVIVILSVSAIFLFRWTPWVRVNSVFIFVHIF